MSSQNSVFAAQQVAPASAPGNGVTSGGNAFRPGYYPPVQPVSGPQQTLVILVEFSDVKHTQDRSSIDALIFGQMAKYYAEVSYGRIEIVGKSVGWYTVSQPMKYYGADTNPSQPGSDSHKAELIRDAVDAAQATVDFNNFSRLVVVHAGIGQEDSIEQTDLIWSEAFWRDLSIPTRNGAIINSAAIAPEMEVNGHSALGVYTHEYGHLLSLPDLYDVNVNSTVPDPFVSRWSVMGTGLWLGDPRGSSPAELEAWSRIKLGWLTPDIAQLTPANLSFQLVALQPLESSSGLRAIKVPTTNGEYYLVELRSKIDFDASLPSFGVLITRIDETMESGGGIVQVIDANPSTHTLNDAAYQVGGMFKDPKNHVFIDVLSSDNDTFSVLLGNQEPSSVALTTTTITAPESINVTYSQATKISAKLTDQFGNSLAGLTMNLQYYNNDRWDNLAVTITDKQGTATFEKSLPLNPGGYYVRFLFEGEKFGDHYLVGNDQLAKLNVGKISTSLQFEGPRVVQATEDVTLTITLTDEFNKPVQNLTVLVWVDGQLARKERITESTLRLTLNFDLYQLGTHTLKIGLEENAFYGSASISQELIVVAPVWVYTLIVAIFLVALAPVYFLIRKHTSRNVPQISGARGSWVLQ